MSSFDEYRKKLTGKYGTTKKKTEDEQEKKPIDGASVWDDSFESTRKEMTARYGGGMDSSKVKEWFTESESTLKSMSDYYKANDGKWVSNFGGDFAGKLDELLKSASAVGYYLRNNKREFSDYDSVSKGYSEYLSALDQFAKQNSSLSEFYSQFGTEDEYNTWYEGYKKQEEYRKLLESDDFDEYSQKGVSVENPSFADSYAPIDLFGWKPFGDGKTVNNMVTFTEANIAEANKKSAYQMINGATDDKVELMGLINMYMTDEEKSIYNYYVGKGETEKADAYLSELTDTFRQRHAGVLVEKADETYLETILAGMAGIEGAIAGIGNIDNLILGKEGDPTSALQYANSTMMSNNEGLWKVANDLTYTTGNMLPSILASTLTANPLVGIAMTGTSASGNAYKQMMDLGYDKWQARGYGLLVGASEAGLQYLLGGISKLGGKVTGKAIGNFVSKFDNAIARTAIQLGGNMASEGIEEGLQTVLEPAFKALVTGEEFEAPEWEEVWYSALLGALSAGVMEGVPTIANTAIKSYQANKVYGTDPNALVGEALEIDPDNAHAQRMKAKLNSGEDISGYQLNRLVEANEQALYNQDKSKMTSATEARLTELGETGDVSKLAKALVKQASGESLSLSEKNLLKKSKYGQRVANELSPANIESGKHDSKWAEGIGTERINTEAYNKSLYDLASEQAGVAVATEEASVTENPTAKENATEAKFEASTDGKTRIGDLEVSIKEVASVKDGEVTLRLEDGSTVNATDVEFGSSEEGLLYENVANMNLNAATANAFIKGYDHSMSVQEYTLGFREAYRYGEYGIRMNDMSTKGFSAMLSESQKSLAYELGKTDTKYKIEAREKAIAEKASETASKKKGKVHYAEGILTKNLTQRQQASLKGLETLANALGVDIYIFESKVVDGKRQGANGWFDPKEGSIHIDLYAGLNGEGTMLFTAAHELTHFIREWSPAKFKVFADFLLEQYGKKGVSVDALVIEQIAKAKRNGRDISYDTAYEEVIADSCEAMLADGDAISKIAKLKAQDKSLWQKIKSFLADLVKKIKAVYEGLTPDSVEGRFVSEMLDQAEKLKAMWTEALVEASENYSSAVAEVIEADAKPISNDEIITDGAVVTDGNGDKYSIRSMKHDISDGQMFRDLMNYCGYTKEQVGELRRQLEDLIEYMNPFRDIVDLNETYDREGRRYSPYKPNSDPLYTISLDFSTQCSKRLLTQYVIEQLQLRENRPMSAEEQMAIRDMLKEYGKVEKGLQVACVMCYVEAARLKAPKQIQKWLDDPATAMRNFFADKNPEFSNYIKEKQADFKESRGYSRDATKKEMSAKDVTALNKIRPKVRAEYNPSSEEMAIIETASSLPNSTYLTAGNLADLSETHPEIYKAYTAFIRTATRSKALETDEPYYYGDSTRDNGNGIIVSDSFIESVNRENGMRFSSWSDWRIQHLLDWITAVIDNSVRGAAMHGYTKYGDEVRVLGKTGMMFNLSGVAGTQTGLNEDGSLNFSETESIDIDEAIALREEFPETAGLQCIGVSRDHIFALLRSDIIDYVIPYHTSGLNATLRRMGDIYGWDDFTQTQHATEDKSIKKENAVDPDHWHQEPVFSEFFVGYDTGLGGVEAMRKSAENYKRMCKERGLKPKFLEFAEEPNYWKLLIDRKMVNQQTNTLIKQKAVTPNFDFGVIKGIIDKYVANYDSGLEQRAFNYIVENWDNIPKRIRDLKKQGTTKAKSTKKAIDKLANETVAVRPKEIKNSDRYSIDNELSESAEVANALVTHVKKIIENTGSWDVQDVFEYVKDNPNLNFIDRILGKDKAVKKDLESFLAGIDDPKLLHSFSWFMGEAYKRKAMRYVSGRYSSPFIGSVRTFRNAIDARINAIMTEKANGTNLGVKNGEISIDDVKGLFDKLNSNPDMSELAERVFATAKKLGVNIRFANQTFSKKAGGGDAWGDMVELKTSYFNDTAYTDQRKAQTILHELIHSCTVYVMNANGDFAGDVHYSSDKTLNYERISNAATRLNRIYLEIKGDPDFKGQYGIKNAKEMVAELANPDFVELLKKKTLWEKIVDWICELFGFRTGTSAYDNAMACLDYILDNPEVSEYKAHALRVRQAAHNRYGEAFGSTVLPDGQVRYSDRDSYAPTFYSHMGKVVDGIKSEKVGANGVVPYLKGKGVKAEEIKWSGIEAFLEGKKSVTKEELQEFVAGSQLQIVEQVSGEDIDLRYDGSNRAYNLYDADGKVIDTFTYDSFLDGYVAESDEEIYSNANELTEALREAYGITSAPKWADHKIDGGTNYRELVFQLPDSTFSNRAMRTHWGQDAEGVLAHARIQDFEVDGKKMLFIEEIQSDWHNEGHQKGYSTEEYEDAVAVYDKLAEDYANKRRAFNKYVRSSEFRSDPDEVSKKKFDWLRRKMDEAEKRMQAAERDIEALKEKGMGDVPDAPFRNNYHEYVLKRLLRMAAEEGYDSIGWTPAEIQSQRWSDEFAEGYRIEYDQDIPSFLKKYGKKWGATVGKERIGEYYKQFEVDLDTMEDSDELLLEEGIKFDGIEVWAMSIPDSMKDSVLHEGQVLYSDRDTDSVSNRSLLANALESVAQNDIERRKLEEYKSKIALIESEQAKLAEIRAKIKELSFAKGRRDTEAIKSLQFEANQAANRINTYDKQLLNLESTKALKDVLQREKELAYKRAEQRGKDALSAYREKAAKTQRELMTRYQESRKKNVEGRKQTAMRHKIKDVVNELNQYLLKGTKDKHVPIELQKAVAEALSAVNMDTVGAEERLAEIHKKLQKDPFDHHLLESYRRISEQGERMDGKLQALKNAYDDIVNSNDPLIANSHDEVISNSIDKVIKEVGSTPLREMTLAQLESVYDMYKMVLTTIRNTNKAFKAAKSEEISVIANRVMEEIDGLGKKQPYRTKASQALSKFDWNNLKPVYAFDRIGSNTFTEVFNNVRAGEDTWAVDITEAKNFSLEQHKKFNYDSWDFKKRYGFTSSSGMHFELSLDQIMSLYAYSKREQARDHLKKGGIVIDETTEVTVKTKLGIPVKFNPTEATAYNLSDETLADIIGKLTTEQKAFVDVMQDYLSTTMGDKGNEVSLALYGVKLYKEKHYFPLKSAQQFMAKAKEQQKGEVKIKNSGFSKETVTKASNPIVLTPFMDVWADHVNEMSMYHAFVLPLEDFYRVYNYKTPTSDTMATESVEMYLQNSYGKGATQYIDQLLKDLNGGARVDSTVGIINKLTGLFKKSAVFASLSVVVQQPSAIARAAALVDTKYFVGKPSGKHKNTWAEVKKYAPVAVIKEMGYFDTGMGQSTVEWLKDEKTWKDKLDDFASKAPAFADELAWCAIWEAVKRETLQTHKDLKYNSDEFLKAVGERFTEVVTKTQVYDSVLARSANMRSKDTGMKMATAFMGEPTTSLNMLENALTQGKRGNKRYARKAVGSVVASMILNSILVSFVYAGRDDDEEKTYAEKYIGTLTEELIDSFNPLTLVPFLKDIVSIAQGYDVERSDMAVITDIVNAWNNLENDNRSVYRKIEDFAGAIASLFGLPVKNVMRDARGMYNTVNSFINGEKTTGAGIGTAITEAVTGKEKSNGQLLYDAIIKGDKAQADRLKGRFEDQKAIDSAIRKALRDNDPRIKQAAEARYNGNIAEYMRIAKAIIAEGNFSQDNIVSAINSEINLLKKDEGTSESTTSNKVKSIYEMSDYYSALEGRDQATAYVVKEDLIKTDMANGKDRDEAEADFNSKFASHLRDLYEEGEISDSKAEDMLVSYGGKSEEEAFSKVRYWDFRMEYPDYDLSEEAVTKYYNDVESSGIGIDVYYDYSKQRSKCKGTDSDGDGKTDSGSVKTEVLKVINSLPITSTQKDALYYLNGWAASTIWQAPWH